MPHPIRSHAGYRARGTITGGIMKGLFRILTSTACLVAIAVSTQARAGESCTIGEHSVEAFAQEYFSNPQARGVSPLLAIEHMLQKGCRDEDAFAQVIEIFLDDRIADIHRRTDPGIWRVNQLWRRIGFDMLMLGHEEPIRVFLDTVRADAEAGNSGAMTALAYLGLYEFSTWNWTTTFREYERMFPQSIAHFDLTEWGERDTHPLREIAPDLENESYALLEKASAAGFAPAHSMHLAHQQPARFSPCSTTAGFGGGLFGMSDADEGDAAPSNRFIETFAELPDREQVARDMMDWSRDVIRSSLESASGSRVTPNTEAAANLTRAYAAIRSNCALSIEGGMVDFGIEDHDEAAIGMHYAVVSPGIGYSWQLALVYAAFIDQYYDNPERHYAAARILQAGGYIDDLEHHNERVDEIVGSLSRETIRAAQEIMAEHGYYTAAIDGIPGPNFRNGLRQWNEYCSTDFGSTPDKCVRVGPSLLTHEWAHPFLGEAAP